MLGRKPTKSHATPPARKLPLCSRCFGIMKRGTEHKCNKNEKRNNLANFVRQSSVKTKSSIASQTLKDICGSSGKTTAGASINLGTGGKCLPVTVGRASSLLKRPKFTADSLKRLQTSLNFSNRQTK